jgi:hypothetical protein
VTIYYLIPGAQCAQSPAMAPNEHAAFVVTDWLGASRAPLGWCLIRDIYSPTGEQCRARPGRLKDPRKTHFAAKPTPRSVARPFAVGRGLAATTRDKQRTACDSKRLLKGLRYALDRDRCLTVAHASVILKVQRRFSSTARTRTGMRTTIRTCSLPLLCGQRH